MSRLLLRLLPGNAMSPEGRGLEISSESRGWNFLQDFHEASRVIDRSLGWKFAGLLIASFCAASLDAIGILLLVPLVDRLSGTQSGSTVSFEFLSELSTGWLLILVVSFLCSKSIGTALIRWWSVGVIAEAAATTATRLFSAYLQAPLPFHDTHNSSRSLRNVTDSVHRIFQYGMLSVATGASETMTLLVLIVLVAFTAPLAASVGLLYFGVASLLYLKVVQKRMREHAAIAVEQQGRINQSIAEGLSGIREHRLRGSERNLSSIFTTDRRLFAKAERFSAFAGEVSRYYLELLVIGGFGVIAAVTVSTSDGSSLPALAVLLAVAFRILPSLSRILAASANYRIGEAALNVLNEDLDDLGIEHLVDPVFASESRFISSTPRRLDLVRVSFAFAGTGEFALTDVTLSVEPGLSLGVVGPSGAGKSTLIDVICGLRIPNAGVVMVDHEPLSPDPVNWNRQVGLVPQEIFLSDSSIADNVAFGLPVDRARVWSALERAQMTDFVRALPDGIDTMIGERGTRLSGGQRQRVGIARALYATPSVLILDEATAALDVETEAAVVESVSALVGDLTLVVVAHRLSTIQRCDRVAYLESGRVRFVGTFEETVEAIPEFARAVDLAGLSAIRRRSN